mmetsp:Transcript_23270/g.65794  ORF Transcript_23270/g.65794 Transcript_23270/m.65794 type:complete len:359 (-) Transcript_23270:86-1162(-)|eukprot:CAMPEP_0177473512 /NCGR_PEP_ID=MMETSP0369-20130122/21941_1 /TAXON_ID=447022 ORGANISM="Scrippsiella hangoei-like, Strain SHHI-4" /NCGR_SAMPLE_ID=MMETSP0369 /ASSEMBLY_ACC=CAM_ASM_000364 /LENGTH=358 /DNA_ID=CAMNT_0018948377 /DNA_START=95 /DNA_END=1171 /DNA_ORIENTATION=+
MAQPPRAGVYFCRQLARCVAPLPGGDNSRHSFMVGTCTLQQRNEIHVVDFDEDTAEVVCRQTLSHPEEIWLLNVNPADGSQVLTYSSGNCAPALRLWQVSDPSAADAELQLLATVGGGEETQLAAVKCALWDPHRQGNLIVADSEALHVFEAGSGPDFKALSSVQVGQRVSGACADPHHANQVSTVDDTHLKMWDLRSSKLAFKKDGAHLFGARDVDYNPNVPYQVLTAGEDAALRFWDLRKLDKSLRSLAGGHHHWVVRARYNGHHDQLVLSCGTDSAVCLWRAGSVASAPLGAGGQAAAAQERPPDGLIRRYEEHEDSCYSCCWSLADAWIFASVAYDGRLVVNRVPGEEKYRILL